MYMTFRWYGKDDPVKIDYIRQIPGMKGIVSAIYDIPVGEVWPLDRILELKKEVEDAGLELSVIESVPVHEDIKLGLPTRDRYIANYNETIRNLSKAGIKTICYNFMPVFDWTRSDLEYRLADGSTCLIYDEKDIAKMDPKLGELELPGWDTSYGEGGLGALLDKYKNIDEMYLAVGFGANSSVKVIARMLQEYRKEHQEINIEEKIEELAKAKQKKQKPSSSGVVVKGIDNCLVKLSKCCNPLPGDEIIGYITKGRGVSVHRKDCINVKDLLSEENRIIDVEWYDEDKEKNKENAVYQADIEVFSNDRTGLLVDILKEIGTTKARIVGVNTKTTKERIAIIDISLEIENLDELNKVLKVLRKVESVYEVKRRR